METKTETAIATVETVKAGYAVKTVVARISEMDVDAAGNGEKAAWKRYMVLALLAIAKGADKKAVIADVFGKGAKASKTFLNMWSLADKARNPMLGNWKWSDVAAMPIDEAVTHALGMVNRHMATLDVTSKNEYDRFCTMTAEEVAASRARDKAEKDAAAAAKEEADKVKAEADATAEAEAQAKADATPERTAAQAALAALQEASRDDVKQVAFECIKRLSREDAMEIRDWLVNALTAEAEAQAEAA